MDIVKRDGTIQEFDKHKIEIAILKAMKHGSGILDNDIATKVANEIESKLKYEGIVQIYRIEEEVFSLLNLYGQTKTARAYEGYRAVREFQRESLRTDGDIMGIIKGNGDNIHDNSNKDTALISTMRDLVAEEVSKDLSLRVLIPPHIAQAHKDGLLYIHDLGHYLNPSINCELINLKDMLENGTVINGKMVEKPHSFRTACTIATQIIAQVASGQFGGQTISIAHLSPFVKISKEKIIRDVKSELILLGSNYDECKDTADIIVQNRLKEEIEAGIQTFQYQINTLQTSNGQAPFLSVFMYISEYPEYEEETAMLIEEMLNLRITGMKNEVGAWITPAFPKLLYATDENNIHEDSKYFYLTELASVCVAKRMMPDFLSAKILKQNYEGNVIPPMGK